MRQIPRLMDANDPKDVKMCWDKLTLLLREIVTILEADEDGQTSWSVGAFFDGIIYVGQPVPRFLVPEDAEDFSLTHLRVTFQGGSLVGDTEIDVSLVSGGVTTLLGTSTLTSTDTADVQYTVELASPITLVAGDMVKWECTAAGGHQDVTAAVIGSQTA